MSEFATKSERWRVNAGVLRVLLTELIPYVGKMIDEKYPESELK